MKYLVCGATKERRAYSLMEAKNLAKQILLDECVCWEALEGAAIYRLAGNEVALEEKVSPDFMDRAQVQIVCNFSVSKSKGVRVIIERFEDATPSEWLRAFGEAIEEMEMVLFADYKPTLNISPDGEITSGELRGKVKVGDKTFTYSSDFVVVDGDMYRYFPKPIYLRRETGK